MNANHVNVAPLVFTVFAALVVSCAAGADGVDKLILPTPVSVEVKQGAVSQDALSRVVTINVYIGKDKLNMAAAKSRIVRRCKRTIKRKEWFAI